MCINSRSGAVSPAMPTWTPPPYIVMPPNDLPPPVIILDAPPPSLYEPGFGIDTHPLVGQDTQLWLKMMLVFYSLNFRVNSMVDSWPHEHWMAGLPQAARDIPLHQLVIPGSHDSFAFKLDSSPGISYSPDLAYSSIGSIVSVLSKAVPSVKLVIEKWSKTQHLTFNEQLRAGIRYFDIRVGFHRETGQIRFLHGLWGLPVIEELERTLPNFLEEHPGEVLLLDFNHFYDMHEEQHVELALFLHGLIEQYAVRYSDFSVEGGSSFDPTNLTLAKLVPKDSPYGRIIVFYNSDIGVALSNFVFWPGDTLSAPWPRKVKTVPELIEYHENRYQSRLGRPIQSKEENSTAASAEASSSSQVQVIDKGEIEKIISEMLGVNASELEVKFQGPQFFVYQGVITPDGSMISRNLFGTLYDSVVTKTTSGFVDWLLSKKPDNSSTPAMADRNITRGALNICIVDGVETFNFIPAVVDLNLHLI